MQSLCKSKSVLCNLCPKRQRFYGFIIRTCLIANIILTEFERLIVSELIADGTIQFYKRYVDDTLVLIKPSNISAVLAKFNSFDPNLNFTVDTFPDVA